MISWVIFYFEDLSLASGYIQAMFGFSHIPLVNNESLYYLISYSIIFMVAAYASTPHFKKWNTRSETNEKIWLSTGATLVYIGVFMICVAYLVDSTYNPFLYFRF